MKRMMIAAALLLGACAENDRANWARACVERGNDPQLCVDASERLYPRAARQGGK